MNEFIEVWSKVGGFKFGIMLAGFAYYWLTKIGLAITNRYMKERMFSFDVYWTKNWVCFVSTVILVVVAGPLLIAEYNLKSWLAVFTLGATGGIVIEQLIQIPMNLSAKKK